MQNARAPDKKAPRSKTPARHPDQMKINDQRQGGKDLGGVVLNSKIVIKLILLIAFPAAQLLGYVSVLVSSALADGGVLRSHCSSAAIHLFEF